MPDKSNSMTPEPRERCVGCGGIHGSIGLEIHCLRQRIRLLTIEVTPYRRLRAEVATLPLSHVKERGK
jgi:hypothetical protein